MFDMKDINYGDSIKNYRLFSYLNENDDLNKELQKLDNIEKNLVLESIQEICGPEPKKSPFSYIYKEIKNELNLST